MTGRLLTLEQAARLLRCSARTVRRRVDRGELPAFRDGRLVRIPEQALHRYVAAHTSRPALAAAGTPARPARQQSRPQVAARTLLDLPDPLATP